MEWYHRAEGLTAGFVLIHVSLLKSYAQVVSSKEPPKRITWSDSMS